MKAFGRSLPRRVRSLLLAASIAAFLGLSVVIAGAVTTDLLLTQPTPPPGSVSPVANPAVGITAASSAALATTSTLTVDGVAVPAYWAYQEIGGHWEDDGCDVWWVPDYDYTRGTLRHDPYRLADGSHSVTATVGDAAGRIVRQSWDFSVAAPPTVTSFAPANDSNVYSRTPAIYATVADNSAVATVSAALDGAAVAYSWTPSSGRIALTLGTALDDETWHVVSVSATDTAGLARTVTWRFFVHTGVPAFSAPSPTLAAPASVWNPNVAVTVADTIRLNATSYISIDGKGYYGTWTPASAEATRATIAVKPPSLPDGNHTAAVTVSNSAGKTASYTWTFAVAAPPQLGAFAPSAGAYVTTRTPVLSAKVTDNGTGPVTGAISVDGVALPTAYDAATKTLSARPASPLADDAEHAVSAVCTDAGGNTSAPVTWSFRVRTSAPSIHTIAPADGTALTVAATTVSFGASDTVALANTATFLVDGKPYSRPFTYFDLGGYWYDDGCDAYYVPNNDLTRGSASLALSALTDGPHSVTASVANSYGAVGSRTWGFSVNEPPKLLSPTPADNAWVTTTNPAITVRATDNSTITAVAISVDGAAVTTTYDRVTKTARASLPDALADDAPHTATAVATDGAGNTTRLTWTFKVHTAGPAFDSATPSPGATITVANPLIAVSAYDWAGLTGALSMYVDNVLISPRWSFVLVESHWEGEGCDAVEVTTWDYTRGTASYNASGLGDGKHTAKVVLRNNCGTSATYSWDFNVAAVPVLSDPSPAAGSRVSTQWPAVSIKVSDNGAIGTVSAAVDGNPASAVYDAASKRVRVTVPEALDNDVAHTVYVTVRDAAGNPTTTSWSFRVQVYDAMPQPTECVSCHSGYPVPNHPTGDCYGCHGGSDCGGSGCHEGGHDAYVLVGTPCTSCHNPSNPYAPVHTPDLEQRHDTSRDMSACRPCHVTPLTVEHYRRTDERGVKLTCATCHSSTDPKVKAAIAADNGDCEACHGFSEHAAAHDISYLDLRCTGCHEDNLMDEHMTNTTVSPPVECGGCHASADPGIASAIRRGDAHCAACHDSAHGLPLTDPAAEDIPRYPGFAWSRQVSAAVYRGDPWMPDAYTGGLLTFSNRRRDVTVAEADAWYRSQLLLAGWTVDTPALPAGATSLSLEATKPGRRLLVLYGKGTAEPSGDRFVLVEE